MGLPSVFWSNVTSGGWVSVLTTLLDVAVIAFVLYKLIMLVKGTRAWQILWGLGLFFLLLFISDWLRLYTLNWILQKLLYAGPVAIVILFYPELRHALEEVGRLGFWGRGFSFLGREDLAVMIDEVVKVATRLSRGKIGALIVIEREIGLDNIVQTGTRLDALASAELLSTVFYPGSPLHDGAAVIRANRVIAVGCTLPLSDSPHISAMIHTRHKAALGVTEQSDAVVVVVSEETGTISLALEGRLDRGLDGDALRNKLQKLLGPNTVDDRSTSRILRWKNHSSNGAKTLKAGETTQGQAVSVQPSASAEEAKVRNT